MAQYNNSINAQRERELRKQQAYRALRNQQNRSSGNSSSGFISRDISVFTVRRTAPFAMLIHATAILFFISWIASSGSTPQFDMGLNPAKLDMAQFEIKEKGKIYDFKVMQRFASAKTPYYSELEIEILDEHYDHVYSVFKDLWREKHPNGEGGTGIYSDNEMKFELALPQPGIYHVRALSYNNSLDPITISVNSKSLGGLYFGYYALIFGAASVILLLGSTFWGSPIDMYNQLFYIKSIRHNTRFFILAVICIVLLIGSWWVAITHYGYPSGGEESILPTYFYRTKDILYLG